MATRSNSARAAQSDTGTKRAKLTPQRENFARHVVMGFTQAEAYRRSYVLDPEIKNSTVWEAASRLANDHKVAARIDELRAEAARSAVLTREGLIADMRTNRALALESGKLSVAQSASRDLAKLEAQPHRPPPVTGDASAMVDGEVSPEARSLNDIARRIAFTLAIGKRKASSPSAPPVIEGSAKPA